MLYYTCLFWNPWWSIFAKICLMIGAFQTRLFQIWLVASLMRMHSSGPFCALLAIHPCVSHGLRSFAAFCVQPCLERPRLGISDTLKAIRLKQSRSWNFQARLNISSESPTKPYFCGEFWRSGLTCSSEIEVFKRDCFFFNLWALRAYQHLTGNMSEQRHSAKRRARLCLHMRPSCCC